MHDPDITDEVVQAASAGNGRAFETIFRALSPSVLGYLRARGVADPEGLTNEVFVGLIAKLPSLTGGVDGVRKVVFVIAHARMVDDYRRRQRTLAIVPYEPESDPRVEGSAAAAAEESFGTERVMEVLRILPDDQRDVLALRVVADLSIEQTAAVIGRSAGAVKQLQRRALLSVRRALEDRRVTL